MIPVEEAQLKLKDLQQAIALEKQHSYVDLQGRRQRFSDYLRDSVRLLSPYFAAQLDDDAILKAIEHYPFADLSGRMRTIDHVLEALNHLALGGRASRPKTVTTSAVTENPADIDVQFVKGVGPRIAALLNRLEIKSVADLLYYFPRKYLDYHNRLKIRDLQEGQTATILATVQGISAFKAKNKDLTIVSLRIKDETAVMHLTWIFAKAHRAQVEAFQKRFVKGADVMVSGKAKWDKYKNTLAMDRPEIEILSYASDDPEEDAREQSLSAGRIVPVYDLTQGLNLKVLRRAIRHALTDHLAAIADPMPETIKKHYQLTNLQTALEQIHFPESFPQYEAARKRLVFDELFYLQLRLAMVRSQYKHAVKGMSLKTTPGGLVDQFLQNLPFALTGAQQRVFQEIQADMASTEPMYRLVQGDVGSGKTVVGILSLLVAVENGYQGVLMAPTEILAEQHYRNFVQWLTPLGLKVGLLVGKSGVKERKVILQGLLNGQIHVAVGTHALIQDGVEFSRLGAVVVDEQHRFGVRQRVLLKNKGENPEMLTMTATPIPRTLAMTLHGDLDVSVLDELPPGRTPIRTALYRGKNQREQAYNLIRHEVEKGRQVYIVYPLIEESEATAAKAATVEYETLCQKIFPQFNIGLLHGKMRPDEKDALMHAFSAGQLQILVSTTVIEVGVDVPNATVMLIENADRFGLAQLHQLRGRVGRGKHQSYCLLLTDSNTPETLERLNIIVESTDGFVIAEKDLEIRGPGEYLGTRQSGLPDLVLADLIQDRSILESAREAAFSLVDNPQSLAHYPELLDHVTHKTEDSFSVISSG